MENVWGFDKFSPKCEKDTELHSIVERNENPTRDYIATMKRKILWKAFFGTITGGSKDGGPRKTTVFGWRSKDTNARAKETMINKEFDPILT